jgi:hypothetical protein
MENGKWILNTETPLEKSAEILRAVGASVFNPHCNPSGRKMVVIKEIHF